MQTDHQKANIDPPQSSRQLPGFSESRVGEGGKASRKEMPGEKPTGATLAKGLPLPASPSSAVPVNHCSLSSGCVPSPAGQAVKDTRAQSWPQTGRSCPAAQPGLIPGHLSTPPLHLSPTTLLPTATIRASTGPSQGPAGMQLEGSSRGHLTPHPHVQRRNLGPRKETRVSGGTANQSQLAPYLLDCLRRGMRWGPPETAPLGASGPSNTS